MISALTRGFFVWGAAFLAAAHGCSTATRPQAPEAAARGHTGVEWDYEGVRGPQSWGSLSPEFALCATGNRQSPIDLASPEQVRLPAIMISYRPSRAIVKNNGHTVQAELEHGNRMQTGGTEYRLIQFHYHVPAEHLLAGARPPLEVHLVHRSATGQTAVLGIFFYETGPEQNSAFQALLETNPRRVGAEAVTVINPADLLPKAPDYLTYVGSLTTPPCSEPVRWLILASKGITTAEQIEALRDLLGRPNARPVQSLEGRRVQRSASSR